MPLGFLFTFSHPTFGSFAPISSHAVVTRILILGELCSDSATLLVPTKLVPAKAKAKANHFKHNISSKSLIRSCGPTCIFSINSRNTPRCIRRQAILKCRFETPIWFICSDGLVAQYIMMIWRVLASQSSSDASL